MPLTDTAPYRKYVDHLDLTDEQKDEVIHTVWEIMESHVAKAFGINLVKPQLKRGK